jgi:hypothetical protein
MVVMVKKILGHLETRKLVTGGDPTHHAGSLEIREMTIGRTSRNLGHASLDVRNAQWTIRGGQEFNHGPTSGGVALIDPAKEHLNELVEVSNGIKGGQRDVSFSSLGAVTVCLDCNETDSHSTIVS